jgi:3-dehydroquinate dehydratase-2
MPPKGVRNLAETVRALILQGPNLNLLGSREPEIYGTLGARDLASLVREWSQELGVEATLVQTNSEGELLDLVQGAEGRFDFLVVNPGALTHTSLALRDALAGHLSNIHAREEWRRQSWISPVCQGVLVGMGPLGYRLALEAGLVLVGGRNLGPPSGSNPSPVSSPSQ